MIALYGGSQSAACFAVGIAEALVTVTFVLVGAAATIDIASMARFATARTGLLAQNSQSVSPAAFLKRAYRYLRGFVDPTKGPAPGGQVQRRPRDGGQMARGPEGAHGQQEQEDNYVNRVIAKHLQEASLPWTILALASSVIAWALVMARHGAAPRLDLWLLGHSCGADWEPPGIVDAMGAAIGAHVHSSSLSRLERASLREFWDASDGVCVWEEAEAAVRAHWAGTAQHGEANQTAVGPTGDDVD